MTLTEEVPEPERPVRIYPHSLANTSTTLAASFDWVTNTLTTTWSGPWRN